MKKLGLILFAALALLSLAQVAGATPDTVTLATGGGPYEKYPGGEFTFTTTASDLMTDISYYASTTKDQVSGPTNSNFQTFCIETNQIIQSGHTYWAVLNPQVDSQGKAIALGTAYLYQQFALGTLGADLAAADPGSTYNYLGTPSQRQASAGDLQNAIWYLENEGGSLTTAYTDLLTAQFGSNVANWKAAVGAAGAYGVEALILTTQDTPPGCAQDQLILTPGTGTPPVPEPGSMLLLGLGLFGLVGVARRRVK